MLSQTSSSVSFWTEPEVKLHTLSACVCVSVSEDTTGSRVWQTYWILMRLINDANKKHCRTLWCLSYVQSLLLHHFTCLHAWSVHVYVCTCVFYVADKKLFDVFSAPVLSVSASRQSLENTGSVMPHLSLFVCVMFHREWGLTGSLKGLRQTFMIHC